MLTREDLSKLLSSDDLNVECEEAIFDAFIAWVNHDVGNRTENLAKLFSHIRLPLLLPQVCRRLRCSS